MIAAQAHWTPHDADAKLGQEARLLGAFGIHIHSARKYSRGPHVATGKGVIFHLKQFGMIGSLLGVACALRFEWVGTLLLG